VRLAGPGDLDEAGRLLHDFNREFGEPSPGPGWLSERLSQLLQAGYTDVLLSGAPPHGLAVLRYRPALFTAGLECYLAELYVVPQRRGQGTGRALMGAVLGRARARGADYVELNTDAGDTAAIALYESLGFHSGHGPPGRPGSFYYERDL
jgi:ribosomal protein S18 acetylase RimI-like enzyme